MGVKIGVVTALLACAGCTAAQGGEPGAAGTPTTTPVITTDAVTVSIEGTTRASDGTTLTGVAVCLRTDPTSAEGAACTTSDGSGAWKFASAASNAWLAVTFVKEGFFPTLRPISTGATNIVISPTDGALIPSTAMASMLNVPMDAAAGHLLFAMAPPGSWVATPATVTARLIGAATTTPVYFDANGDATPGASAGTAGAFANLPPGYYETTFAGDSVSCAIVGGTYGYPITAFAESGVARLLVPVVEGFLTTPVAVSCKPAAAQ
jgi:hypothetical protein